jgi:hypothetical protein
MKTFSSKALFSGLLISLLLLSMSAFAFGGELDEIKGAIQARRARWHAGETAVSRLHPNLRRLRVGLIKPEISGVETFVSGAAPPTGLDPSLDWRSNNGNYVTGVRDQGNCGSCWAFATTGALESNCLINNGSLSDLNLAEQVLVSCSRAGSCSGGYIDRASDYIRDTGLPGESCYPYTATNGKCAKACPNWQPSAYGISSWSYVATTKPTVDTVKNALATYGPLVTTMDVYTDFFYYQGGIYSYSYGSRQGAHAILIAGYDDPGQYFIVKNSWGTDWGEQGFFRIAYSQVTNLVKFGYYTIAYHPESACTYGIAPTGKSFPGSGGSGVINVSAGDSCPWNAVSNASWITITSYPSGDGNGTVTYNVAPNPSSRSTRKGTITIAGSLTFTISQQSQQRRGR